MRLSNELDQNFVRAAVPDGAAELLSFLPSLGTAETMVFGESVNLPMRVILNTLPEEYRPHSSSAEFTDLWNRPDVTPEFMETVFERWRARSLGKSTKATSSSSASAQTGSSQNSLNAIRHNLRQQVAAAPTRQAHQMTQAPLSPPTSPTTAAGQMRQRLQNVAAKPSSLSDVKSMLNTAFNRDM
jgi:hypothetical protein